MKRPATGRRSLAATLVVCLVILAVPVIDAQVAMPQRGSRLWNLARWTDALLRHTPGEADEALRTLDGWTSRDIEEFRVHFLSTFSLMRDPSSRIFMRPPPSGSGRAVQIFYSLEEIRQLLALAARLEPLGDNHVLKRGAMLHTDAALLSPTDSSGRASRSDFYVFRFSDGQELNRGDAVGHWEMARFLLDRVQAVKNDIRPNPASDDWVRRWYRSALTYQLARMQFNVGIANRGLEIFRDDPELLFLRGAMHETLASPAIQEALREADFYLRKSVGVSPRKGELNAAEDLLRRAVKLSPAFVEARLHLGHVLAELDRPKDAVPELSQALASIRNKTLLYYGHLFAGRSHAALGDAAAARAAFERAAAQQPAAQSPLLALSQLAYSRGNPAEAAALLARVTDLPAVDGDDPWWTYNTSVGRFFPGSRQDIVDTLRAEMPK
jgi:tetratricopeptide (TPR) repeat protein